MWPKSRRENAGGAYADHHHTPEESAPSHIGRFRLEDQVLGGHGKRLWRAYDERLHRMVALRLVDSQDPLHDDLRAAACAAARVVDRRVVRVLDVLDHEGTLVIVTEWVDAIPLEQLLTTSMTPTQSVEVTRRVAEAIGHIHSAGVTHGRVRPASVMIDKDGEVRVRGHMIDARIYGIDPGNDPAAADISGLGAVMTACLTGRWPGDTPTALPAAPIVAGKRTLPSQLRADLPESLDTFVVRAMAAVPGPETVHSDHPYPDAAAALDALAAIHDGSGSLRNLHQRPSLRHGHASGIGSRSNLGGFAKTAAFVGGVLAIVFAVGIGGSRLFIDSEESTASVATPSPKQLAGVSVREADTTGTPETSPILSEQVLPITGVMTLLPKGKGVSTAGRPEAAIDGNAVTAWLTPRYKQAKVKLSEASGVVVDLGEVRQVRAVTIGLLGNNSTVQLRVSEQLGEEPSDYQLLQKAENASTNMTLREARPLATRYLLVTLTSLPKTTGKKYQGGISSIQVRG